jgi:2,3-bisphosphoglycerate-independent phosphoglycerate mutase
VNLELLRDLSVPNDTKILLLVIDGLGGLPNESGRSELEQAAIPKLDRLAQESLCGLTVPWDTASPPAAARAPRLCRPGGFTVGCGVLEALASTSTCSCPMSPRAATSAPSTARPHHDRRAYRIPTAQSAQL